MGTRAHVHEQAGFIACWMGQNTPHCGVQETGECLTKSVLEITVFRL